MRTPPGRLVDWHQMDSFVARRRGWRWTVVCVSAQDGIEREATMGARFWRRLTAERLADAMRKVMMDALWRAQAHPHQHGAVPVAAVGGLVGPHGATAPAEG